MRRLAKYVPILAILGTVTVISAAPDATAPVPAESKTSPLTVEEMQTRSVAIQVQLDDDTQFVLHLKEIAKKQKDVIKLNCVNDRLVELKAQRNIADQANTSLQVSLSKNGDDRHSLFAQLTDVSQSVKVLREQASACIGEPELFKQESGVEVHHPEIVDDPTHPTFEVEVEAPAYASPFH